MTRSRSRRVLSKTHIEEVDCVLCNSNKKKVLQVAGPFKLVRCTDCGLIYVSPRPTPKSHNVFHNRDYFRSFYHQGIDEFYAEKKDIYRWELRKNRPRLRFVEEYCRKGRLLDVGMGQGMFVNIAREKGWKTHGTDICEYVAEYHLSRGINVFCGHLEDAGYPSDYFDVVTFWHTLEHTFNPLSTLREAYRIAKPLGYVIIAFPNTNGLGLRLRLFLHKPIFHEDIPELHFYYFTRRTMALLLDEAAFSPVINTHEPSYSRRLRDAVTNRIGDLASDMFMLDLSSTILVSAQKPK